MGNERPGSWPIEINIDPLSTVGLAPRSSFAATRTVIPLPGNVSDLALDPVRPRAYAADRTNNRVYAVDLDNGSVLASIPVQSEPTALAIRPAGERLYVGHASNQSIMVVDLGSLAVVQTFATTFLTWDMVAPDAATLVVTTQDDQWRGDYVHILDSSDGRVVQSLCWSQLACNKFFGDVLVAMSPDASWLFLAGPGYDLYAYRKYIFANYTLWSYVESSYFTNGWGMVSDARDLAISPDNKHLYVASVFRTLLDVNTSDFTVQQTFGSYRKSSAVVVSHSGNRVAMSAGDAAIHVFDDGGARLWDIALTGPVSQLRLTADGKRFVAVTGNSTLEVVSASSPPATSLPLSEVIRPWLLYGGLVATTTEGLVFAVLIFRRRHEV